MARDPGGPAAPDARTSQPRQPPGDARLAGAVQLVQNRGGPAQLCVILEGQVVLDRAFGCAPDALFFLFSAGKPYVALLVHLLAERGALALDDPVARYWPEFGQQGKQAITIRQVLQHRSGLPVARSMVRDALAMTSWQASVRALERAAPRYPPGQVPAYHVLSYGFLLGEVVQRVTGTTVASFLHDELLAPLGLRNTYLGLPAALWSRHVPVSGRGAAAFATARMINRRATRQAVIPAANVSATASDLAWFYQALLNGEPDGTGVLRPRTIGEAVRPSSDGDTDEYLKLPVRWSQGFQLGGERAGRPGPMGTLASRAAFGHNGSYVCLGWADPERHLAVGYVTARLVSRRDGAAHLAALSDGIIAALS
jgi:CubicO group peptidase (beta-lactamase class C family)